MVDKKGFIRTLESIIAILLVIGFVYYITPRAVGVEEEVPEVVENAQRFILDSILYDEELRSSVIDSSEGYCNQRLDEFVEKNKPVGFDYGCTICNEASSCANVLTRDNMHKSVYTDSIFIYGANQKVVRIYFWRI